MNRLFTINNANFKTWESDGKPLPYKTDMLHINSYGLKKLCLNIKFGLYRSFGMKFVYKRPANVVSSDSSNTGSEVTQNNITSK